ncbi:MAG: DUF6787 family protein [Flammeovirgaceae bacterium]
MSAETQQSEKVSWLIRLQEKWQLKNMWQVVAVLITFSLAGSSVVFCRKILFDLLGFDATSPFWLKTVTYLALVFPLYQILLLSYGFLLGQFSFFWEKEKKMLRWIARRF